MRFDEENLLSFSLRWMRSVRKVLDDRRSLQTQMFVEIRSDDNPFDVMVDNLSMNCVHRNNANHYHQKEQTIQTDFIAVRRLFYSGALVTIAETAKSFHHFGLALRASEDEVMLGDDRSGK
jgi:hypothetical protein